MSKRRDLRNRTNGSINNMSLDDRKLRNSSIFGTDTIKSKYIPVSKHHMSDATVDLVQNKKDKMFNRYLYPYIGIFPSSGNPSIKTILLNYPLCLHCAALKKLNPLSINKFM